MPGARVHHDNRRLQGVNGGVVGRNNADESIIDRALKFAPVKDKLGVEVQDIGRLLGGLRQMDVPALVESLKGEEAPLPSVRPVVRGCVNHGLILRQDVAVVLCLVHR